MGMTHNLYGIACMSVGSQGLVVDYLEAVDLHKQLLQSSRLAWMTALNERIDHVDFFGVVDSLGRLLWSS